MRSYSSSIKIYFAVLPALFAFVFSSAQVPHYGIYSLFNTSDNYFSSEHYAKYIINPGRFYNVNIVPDKEIERYDLPYALVSADTSAGIVKVALLRDTVSKQGKEKLRSFTANISYSESWQPAFSQEFLISSDTISNEQTDDEYFPSRPDISGQWVFDNHFDYGNLLAFVNLPPDEEQLQRYDSASHTYRSGSSFTFGESFFHPYKNAKIYADLIFTFNRDSIALYSTVGKNVKPASYFRQGEYIAVKKDSAGWIKADRIIIVPDTQRYYIPGQGMVCDEHDVKIISGWIKKDDLVDNPWIKQKQQTALFRFEVSGSVAGPDDGDSHDQVDAIKIINKKTGRQQCILHIGAELYGSLDDVVQVQDCNFDGYPDIWIRAQNGGASPNYTNDYYLYNRCTGKFEYNEQLSNLPQIEIDNKAEIITSNWRDGAARHGGEQYSFKNGKLDTVTYWEDIWEGAYFGKYTEGKKVNGQWQESSYAEANITAKEAAVFAQPVASQKPVGKLSEGNLVIIRRDNPLWFYTEGSDSSGRSVHGWIKKEKLFPQYWLKCNASDSLYRFEVTDSNTIVAIKIIEKSNDKSIQILTGVSYAAEENALETGNYYFDGRPAFRIRTDSGSYGIAYDYFVYNKKEKQFIKDTVISNLYHLVFYPSGKTVEGLLIDENDKSYKVKYQYQYSGWVKK